jgi:hypothetical protein
MTTDLCVLIDLDSDRLAADGDYAPKTPLRACVRSKLLFGTLSSYA